MKTTRRSFNSLLGTMGATIVATPALALATPNDGPTFYRSGQIDFGRFLDETASSIEKWLKKQAGSVTYQNRKGTTVTIAEVSADVQRPGTVYEYRSAIEFLPRALASGIYVTEIFTKITSSFRQVEGIYRTAVPPTISRAKFEAYKAFVRGMITSLSEQHPSSLELAEAEIGRHVVKRDLSPVVLAASGTYDSEKSVSDARDIVASFTESTFAKDATITTPSGEYAVSSLAQDGSDTGLVLRGPAGRAAIVALCVMVEESGPYKSVDFQTHVTPAHGSGTYLSATTEDGAKLGALYVAAKITETFGNGLVQELETT